jgi:hypothetical protein
MYRFVWGYAGAAFTVYFAAIHFLVNVTVAVAVFVGVAQCLVSPQFRRTYDAPKQSAPAMGA